MPHDEFVYIVPLDIKYLRQATKLVKSVFKEEVSSISDELKASIDKKEFIKYKKKIDRHTMSMEYFIAINRCNEVLGIVGLYSLYESYEDTYWLGWYCVGERNRGKGTGLLLLNYAINEVKQRKKKFLCLYTSTDDNEAKAQELYEKNGFYITKKIKKKGYYILYRTKEIN